jgi:ribonuclease Z
MAQFQINILGCGSATPSLRHHPSSQVVNFRDKLFMIDCGEGAQLQMRRMGLKFNRLNHIFLSHLHGDHCFGLPGLLSTMALHEKGGAVTVHTFADGVKMFKSITDMFCRETPFEIQYDVIKTGKAVVYEDNGLIIETFTLYHRLPCVGYIFREKPKLRHLKGDMVKFYNVPVRDLQSIKEGYDWINPADGQLIKNEWLTTAPSPSMSYAYCSDTVFDERVIEAVKGVDVIYHEATYADDQAEKAAPRGHATAREAGRVAREAGAKKLILGHFSKSYYNEDLHLAEAREEFPDVIIANEGLKIDLL